MHKSTLLKAKRILLGISVLINIGLLAYFKYANFLVENFNEILSLLGYEPINWASVALPIGISFSLFKS